MSQAPSPSQRPQNLHQRITSPDDEEVDPLLQQTGCVAPYAALEECLGSNDRNWTKCQAQVQALKQCHDKQQQLKAAKATPPPGARTGQQVLLLYRRILKAAKLFPSVKKEAILSDIKLEFRAHKALSDQAAVRHELDVALRSLEQLEGYAGMGHEGSSELAVSLKGSCD